MRYKYLIIGAIIAGVLLIAFEIVRLIPPHTISLSAGREGGAYYQYALEYKKQLDKVGFQVTVLPGPGSIENIKRLNNGTTTAAFVQTGVSDGLDTEHLVSLGSLFYEPIWVFYRADKPINFLVDLRGRRIAIGEEGSGVRPAALLLLNDNGINITNTTFLALNNDDLLAKMTSGDIDAAFLVASPRADMVRKMISIPQVALFDFKQAAAYRARHPFLTSIKLSQGMVDLPNNLPRQDTTLLSATANLVVRDDIHNGQVRALLSTARRIQRNAGLLEAEGEFPSVAYTELRLSDYARRVLNDGPTFLESIFSDDVVSVIDPLLFLILPLLALYPILSLAPVIYNAIIKSLISRWYKKLREFDSRVDKLAVSEITAEIENVLAFEREINERTQSSWLHKSELYDLKSHVWLIIDRLKARQERG